MQLKILSAIILITSETKITTKRIKVTYVIKMTKRLPKSEICPAT